MPKHRVLVVDDIPDTQATVAGILRDAGYEVQAVSTREAALEELARKVYRVAVVDMRLDEQDEDNREGLELAEQIKRESPRTQVIILTGHADLQAAMTAREPDGQGQAIAFAFVQKEKDYTDILLKHVITAINTPKIPIFEDRNPELTAKISFEPKLRTNISIHGIRLYNHRSDQNLNLNERRLRGFVSSDVISRPDRRLSASDVGSELFRKFFNDDNLGINNALFQNIGIVSTRDKFLIAFESTNDWLWLPLEIIYNPARNKYIVLDHPVIRQIRDNDTQREIISSEFIERIIKNGQKLRILIILSLTSGNFTANGKNYTLPDLIGLKDLDREIKSNLEFLDWLEIDIIENDPVSTEIFGQKLESGHYHIVHFIGHGQYNESSPERSGLYFTKTDKESSPELLKATELEYFLQKSTEVRLVILTCCEGARTGTPGDLLYDDLLGLPDAVLKAGVPAVLGSRWILFSESAKLFVNAFYESFVKCGLPAVALLHARQVLYARNPDDFAWLSPILISQG